MLKKFFKNPSAPFVLLFLFIGAGICTLLALTELEPADPPFEVTTTLTDSLLGIFAGITAIALGLSLVIERFRPDALRGKARVVLKVLVALLVICASCVFFYMNRAWTKRYYPKFWDSYHYFVGAKYYPELGYTKFYGCHLKADSERRRPRFRDRDRSRDLATYQIRPVRDIRKNADCSAFTAQRWAEFRRDLDFFDRHTARRAISDHGYNGTPFSALLASNLAQLPEPNFRNMVLLAFIDIIGLCLMLAVVTWAFGWKIGVLFALFFFTNFADRYHYIGASFFRYQWMVCLGLGLAFLHKKRHALSAVFLVMAAMLNVFPLLYFVGLALKTAYTTIKERKLAPHYRTFIIWAVVASCVCGGLSLTHTRPVENYREFFSTMEMHAELLTRSRIGLRFLFLLPTDLTAEGRRPSYADKQEFFRSIRGPFYVVAGIILLMGLAIACRLDDLQASVFVGFLIFFTLFSTVEYYYASAAVLVLFWGGSFARRRSRRFLALLFGMMAVTHGLWHVIGDPGVMHNGVMSVMFTIYLAALMSALARSNHSFRGLTGKVTAAVVGAFRPVARPLSRWWKQVALGLLVAACVATAVHHFAGPRQAPGPRYALFASGDTILARRMHFHVSEQGTTWPLEDLRQLISDADIAMTNLETVIATEGDMYPKSETSPYFFRGRPELLDVLTSAGFDFLATGNNHALDYGPRALAQQRQILEASGIASAGSGDNLESAARPAYVKTSGGVVVAFISALVGNTKIGATESGPGVFRIEQESQVLDAVRGAYAEARPRAHLVVFTPHWGYNLTDNPTAARVKLAHGLIDLGFDAIIGHSAHHLHGIEVYKQRPIVYDMGNFIADWTGSERMRHAAGFVLEFNAAGFHRVRVHPIWLDSGRARQATAEEATKVRRLLRQ